MRCYTAHKQIVRFMKIMVCAENDHMDNSVCIHPSSDLLGMCCEVNLSEPVYSEVPKERFKFQFSVQLMTSCCEFIETDGEISATGYSFRDKSDAIESAALAMLDLLMYNHGIRSALYSDLVFLKDWHAYNHISENLKATCSALLDITADLSSLVDVIHQYGNLFESEKSSLISGRDHASESGDSAALLAVLSDCQAELQSTHEFLSAGIREHIENVRWRYSHRFYHKTYYKAVHSLHNDLDIKTECTGTLKATLSRVCERSGYLVELLPSRCESEDQYTASMVLIKRSNTAELEKKFNISNASCSKMSECERDVVFRGIKTICVEEGLKIVDAGYVDLRDMQKENCEFKHEVPFLCNVATKLKAIAEDGFKNIDALSQHHYRRLKDPKLSKEVRLSLADCICDFIHIIRSFDEEVKKMETYSSN